MRVIFLSLFIFFSSCYLTDEVLEDQDVWEYDLPGNQQMSEADLLAINTFINTGRFEFIRSYMIVRNNKLVFENHFVGSSRNKLRPVDKLTLIFSQLAIGIALENGLIDSVRTPIYELLPGYQNAFEEQASKRAITIENLLLHNAGFSWNESVIAPESPNNDINLLKEADDATAFILSKPLEALPGTRYNFNSGTGFIVSKIIEEVSGQTLEAFVKETVFAPLHITKYVWMADPSGTTNGSDGLEIGPIDLLKIGQLYLNQGIWKGAEIIPFNWFTESTGMQSLVSSRFGYGYYWNKFNPDFENNIFNLQDDGHIYMNGDSGDALYVLPQENLVVVIFAENLQYQFFNPSLSLYRATLSTLQ
ncbi:MAG: serine hydrolase domain-containing protein [Cyclobacteriaceae bacterium]